MAIAARKAIRRAARLSEPLPSIPGLQRLHDDGVKFRRGQLVMIAGLSNGGKSMIAEWMASEMNVPTLYFSADQDEWTTMTRLVASQTGASAASVSREMHLDPHHYDDLLSGSQITFSFDSNPSVEDIGEEVDAFVELWDEWPELIIVDNLVNIEGSGEHEVDQWIMGELHNLARTTKACVIVLAHLSEVSTPKPTRPGRKKDIINKLSKFPELILTVAYDPYENTMYVAKVKSRESKADPLADMPYALGADMGSCQFFAQPTPAWGYGNYYDQEAS